MSTSAIVPLETPLEATCIIPAKVLCSLRLIIIIDLLSTCVTFFDLLLFIFSTLRHCLIPSFWTLFEEISAGFPRYVFWANELLWRRMTHQWFRESFCIYRGAIKSFTWFKCPGKNKESFITSVKKLIQKKTNWGLLFQEKNCNSRDLWFIKRRLKIHFCKFLQISTSINFKFAQLVHFFVSRVFSTTLLI